MPVTCLRHPSISRIIATRVAHRLMSGSLRMSGSQGYPAIELSNSAGGNSLDTGDRDTREVAMDRSDIARVQAYLRKTLGSDLIHIDVPKSANGPVELRAGREFLGTVHRDEEDGEISFSVHMTILEEDLPAAAPPTVSGVKRR